MKVLINQKTDGTKQFISWGRLVAELKFQAKIKPDERIEAIEVDSEGVTVVIESDNLQSKADHFADMMLISKALEE